MQSFQLEAPDQLDRFSILPWLRSVLAALSSVERDAFYRETVAPGGMPMELLFDDPDLAALTAGQLTGRGTTAPPQVTHFVLTGPELGPMGLPWTDRSLSFAEFEALLESGGLKATYRDRTWRIFDNKARVGAQLFFRKEPPQPWDDVRLLVDWSLASAGFSLTHAGTVGLNGRGLLLVGLSGAGKSGTTLAGLAEGLETVGDDFVALRSDAAPVVRSIFPVGRQDPSGLTRIAGLHQRISALRPSHKGKFEFDLRQTFPGAFVDELTVEALVLPTLSDAAAPAIRPISATDAMVELLRSNPFRDLGQPHSRMARFGTLARSRPCYRLELSHDAARNGRALRSLIETLPI